MITQRPASVPRIFWRGDRVLIQVGALDADELREHLRSHNIRTTPAPGAPAGFAWLEVHSFGAEEVGAVLSEWEVALHEAPARG